MVIISHSNILSMTTNFRVRVRREYESDERFTRLERTRILTHISSVRRVCERTTNPLLCGTWYSAVFKLEQLRTLFVSKNIRSRVAMVVSRSGNSVCIFLNTNVFYVLFECLRFWGVHMLWSGRIALSRGVCT